MKDQDVFRALRTQCIIIKYELRFIIGFLKFTLRKIKLRNLPFQIDGLQCMKQVVEDSNAFFPAFFFEKNELLGEHAIFHKCHVTVRTVSRPY